MKVYVIAGEASGDRLGAALIAGLNDLAPKNMQLRGVCGPEMMQAGVQSLFPMQELSLMGVAEILPKYFHLKRRMAETVKDITDWQPDILITIDAPEFCLRVARAVKEASPNIRTVHYVAPSVWAWRPKRATRMAKYIDHVLALLPFEPPYMHAAGIPCDFVGHPIATVPSVTNAELAAFRTEYKVSATEKTLAVLPGSRKSELKRLLPVFERVLSAPKFQNLKLLFPTLPHLAGEISDFAQKLPQHAALVVGNNDDPTHASRQRLISYAAADVALAASGTVSLELAAAGTPMVIAYDMNWLSRFIISRMLQTDTVTLVNLVSETRIVPEFIGTSCIPAHITPALEDLLNNPSPQLSALRITMERLGQGGEAPGHRAAKVILDQI